MSKIKIVSDLGAFTFEGWNWGDDFAIEEVIQPVIKRFTDVLSDVIKGDLAAIIEFEPDDDGLVEAPYVWFQILGGPNLSAQFPLTEINTENIGIGALEPTTAKETADYIASFDRGIAWAEQFLADMRRDRASLVERQAKPGGAT